MNLNPSYDHWIILDERPTLPHVLRGEFALHQIDGKGLNIARVLGMLDCHDYVCLNVLGGPVGEVIDAQARQLGIPAVNLWIEGESRMNTALVHRYDGRHDVQMINEPGPDMRPAEVRRLKEAFRAEVAQDDLVVVSGSAVGGFGPDDFRDLAWQTKQHGAKMAVDIAGDWLTALVQESPYMLKVNDDELRLAFGVDARDIDELCRFRRAHGIGELVITFGSHGAVALTSERVIHAVPPRIGADYAVGSGDSFFAGYLFGLTRGEPLEEAMRRATACGVANATKLGAGLISYEDYAAYLDRVEVHEVTDGLLLRD